MLEDIEISNIQIVFRGDFNLIFDCRLETDGGNTVLKKKSLAKLIVISGSLNLCDIWRIRNPQKTFFTHFIRMRFLVSFKED